MNALAYANFRGALKARLKQLSGARRIPGCHVIDREHFAMHVGNVLGNAALVIVHGLARMPRGVGTRSWQALVSAQIRRLLMTAPSELEERWIQLAVASAVRFALLEGITYSGKLDPLEASEEELGGNAAEAIAFARAFCPSTSWHELAPLVVLASDREWSAVVETVDAAGLDEERRMFFRDLRVAYDAYVTPSRALVLPGRASSLLALTAAA